MSLLSQIPVLDWETTVEHSVTAAVVLFAGYGLFWIARRLFGIDGIITLANQKNTETMERNSQTLIELKDLQAVQQGLCTRHAVALESLDGVHDAVSQAAKHSKAVADSWAGENAEEFKVMPVLDALLKGVDTAEDLARKCNCDFAAEVKTLRSEITAIKEKIQAR